jgi:MscS family membrane protein
MTAADRIASRIAEIWKDPIHGGFQHLSSLFKVTLFIVLTMGILKIFGFNMSALFAGLGIGGLAIGLALQATLKDMLGSMILIADHPIKCGDYVNVGMGYAWAPSRGYDGTMLSYAYDTILQLKN